MKKHILAVLFALIAFSPSLHAQTEIGIQLYTLRNQFKSDVPGTLALIEQWGIHEIEGGGTYGLPLDEFKKMLKDHKLTMISVGADYKQLKDNPQAAVDQAKAFGAKYVICTWIPHNGEFTLDNAKEAVEVFNNAGRCWQLTDFRSAITLMDMSFARGSRVPSSIT